ncbi:MAG TPA: TIGR03960 family B12-binding radical SAM protein, partial [Mycobacteriales bacterium]|nr:TIGR03960 family B12-binding radical SAM protein [Mycobacteriales bacterium]
FSTELGYTNMLEALDLGGIPVLACDRDTAHPVVIAGGHAAFNPEPIADFIDAAVLGDGDQAVLEVTEVVRGWKREGSPGGRPELLLRLAAVKGVYVPSLYDVEYLPDGRIKRVVPTTTRAPYRVQKRTVMDLDEWPYPKAPLVPLAETVHERMSVEIFRGCTRGCRFCQAGMITRPVRERSITGIGEMVERGLAATGYEEVGLLSLSSADHSEIGEIAKGLAERYAGSQTSLSLPSTRVDAFNVTLAQELSRNGRRSGLTFAPEGGSERLRRVINKTVSKDDLIRTVTTAYAAGWRQVKLYFMCGLPTETDEDVLEIADLARAVIKAGREATGQKDVRCTVSIGGFVPKPHTPFQWASQADHDTTDRRLRLLKDAIGRDRSIGFRYHDGKPGIVEGLLSRGDRRIGAVIRRAWETGAKFDGWSEHFSYDRWMQAAADAGVAVDWYTTRERGENEVLPWDHLDSGLEKEWLWADWQDALREETLDDCRDIPCFDCGVCPGMNTQIQVGPTGRTLLPLSISSS